MSTWMAGMRQSESTFKRLDTMDRTIHHHHSPTLTTPARFQITGPLFLAGLRGHITAEIRSQIADLWHSVGPQFDKLAAQSGDAYGVCSASDVSDEIDYLAAIEISSAKGLPPNWITTKIPRQRYAVFPHQGNVSEISDSVREIFEHWLPDSDYETASGRADFLEHYGKGYDPKTGTRDIEIWVPLKS